MLFFSRLGLFVLLILNSEWLWAAKSRTFFQESPKHYSIESNIPVLSLNPSQQENLNTSLRIAARVGRIEEMKRLYRQGADINSQSDEGTTALMYASQNCLIPVVNELLALNSRVDVNAKDRMGRTALMHAAKQSCYPVVQLLLKNPRTLTKLKDVEGNSAVTYAGTAFHIADAIRVARFY